MMCATGLTMVFAGLEKEAFHTVEEIHELFYFGLLSGFILHIIGVVRYEVEQKVPVVSYMIHGTKK